MEGSCCLFNIEIVHIIQQHLQVQHIFGIPKKNKNNP